MRYSSFHYSVFSREKLLFFVTLVAGIQHCFSFFSDNNLSNLCPKSSVLPLVSEAAQEDAAFINYEIHVRDSIFIPELSIRRFSAFYINIMKTSPLYFNLNSLPFSEP